MGVGQRERGTAFAAITMLLASNETHSDPVFDVTWVGISAE
jgi:hypothetical protein